MSCIRSASCSTVASVSEILPRPESSQVCCPAFLRAVRRQTSCCLDYQVAVSRGVMIKCENGQRRRGKFRRRYRRCSHAAHSFSVVAWEPLARVRAMTSVAQSREARFGAPGPTYVKVDVASTGPVVRAVFGVFEEASRQTCQPV